MLSPLRNRFGIPGVISVIALVFAMLGGAYAASNSGDGKATASAKAKKGPRGPKGPAGPAGPAGPQGPAGAAGKDGANGSNGTNGKDGTNGTNGASVTNTKLNPGNGNCPEGGAEFKVGTGTATFACSGAEGEEGEPGEDGPTGPEGPKGDPWTLGGTLPPGATETGTWAFNGGVQTFTVEVGGEEKEITVGDTEGIRVPISFPIPLAAPLPSAHVHFGVAAEEGFKSFCPAATPFNPEANPGELCVYRNNLEGLKNATFGGIFRFSTGIAGGTRAGAMLKFDVGPEPEPAYGAGSFAVTGCTPPTEAEPTPPFVCP